MLAPVAPRRPQAGAARSTVDEAFVDGLAPINALADGSPGFVWRLQTGDGEATAPGSSTTT